LRIAVHVGAGTAAKRWPDDHWRDLVAWLVVRLGAEVVLVGGKEERIIARHITGPSPYRGVIDWTGQLGVAELAAVIGQSDLFVGADSGPAHLAAAVGTPAVVLFSGTNDPGQWRPWGSGVTVVRREVRCSPCHGERCPLWDHPCMKDLEVEAVARAVQQAVRGGCYAEA
jgi:ADP-heptose:LPS heptosyltransferase